ncbi:MAG: T9SS type A sorting domain-containing protein [bacterium]|nr:T9SS type A sorting domain-containing protein [bacterium]
MAPGDSLAMRAVFDATGLATGLYYDVISLFSNDPAGPHAVHATLAIGEVTGVGDGPPTAAGPGLAGWPNPFNPRTTVRFDLPREGRVELAVYDLQGRRVRTLLAGNAAAGPHEVLWPGDDDAGRTLPSGVYLARLRGPGGTAAERKLTLVR